MIGLALSGGGIRSATTNIGVLQGLSERGVLPLVDYLSTVSGGGYIGACLSSLLATTDKASELDFTTKWDKFPFREDKIDSEGEGDKQLGKDQMHHMRVRASYLAPRARQFSPNVMRALGAVFGSTVSSLIWFVLLLTIITSIYMFVVLLVAPGLDIQSISDAGMIKVPSLESGVVNSSLVQTDASSKNIGGTKLNSESFINDLRNIFASAQKPLEEFKEVKSPLSLIISLGVLLVGGIIGGLTALLLRSSDFIKTDYGLFLRMMFYLLLAVLLGGGLIFHGLGLEEFAKGAILVIPPLFICGALLATGVYYCFVSRNAEKWDIDCRSRFHRLAGVLFVFLLLTLILAVLPGFMVIGVDRYTTLLLFTLGVGLRYAITGSNNKAVSQATSFSLPSKYKEWLLGIFTWVFFLLAVIFVGNLISESFLSDLWPSKLELNHFMNLLVILAGSILLLAGFNFLVDANKIASHYFYRDRLAEAFLETKDPDKKWTRNDKEIMLADVHGDIYDGEGDRDNGPYLLLNATLNLTASKNLKAFNRKSGIFTFSRLYVGSEKTGYLDTKDYMVDGGPLKLARAMTISGAAVTSVMGMNTSLITSFLCTVFGVRLGYWLPNFKNEDVKNNLFQILEKRREMEGITSKSDGEKLSPEEVKKIKKNKKELRRLRGEISESANRRLLNEMFAHTTAKGKEIYLSDGGHSGDNLGIIPLLRRRVRVLIVSDSECDLNHSFDSFNSSVRNAYVDEGIRIEISLAGFRKDTNNLTSDKLAVGRIFYPGQDKDQRNWLILYKNTMTGKEIAPIVNYKEKSQDFPHESTSDQFFTEEQFESYRALGRFALAEAFESKEGWLNACSVSAKNDKKSCKEVYKFLKQHVNF
ncbi:MAG: patatin-like phospholipase family protein [Thermodesulfobacteriota bacterium]